MPLEARTSNEHYAYAAWASHRATGNCSLSVWLTAKRNTIRTCNKGCHLSQLPKANDQHIDKYISCSHGYLGVCVCAWMCVCAHVPTHSIDTVNNSCNCVQITELANVHLDAFALLFSFQLKLSLSQPPPPIFTYLPPLSTANKSCKWQQRATGDAIEN